MSDIEKTDDIDAATPSEDAAGAAGADAQPPVANAAAQRKTDKAATYAAGLDAELRDMYGDEDLSGVDMTVLEQSGTSLFTKVLITLVVFFGMLAAVSWAGFFFFSPSTDRFSGEGVTVAVEGPREVKGGELVRYVVRYENGEDVALGTASLELRLPKEFLVTAFEPSAESPTWQLGSIGPGKSGMVTVDGILLAPLDRELDLQAILTYRPANFNSEFQKVETSVLKVTESVLGLEVVGSPKVLPGDSVTFTLNYQNASENAFDDLRVRAVFPENFIMESAEPAVIDPDVTEWRIEHLDAKAQGAVTVTGSFASDAKGRITFPVEIGFVDEQDEFRLQKRAEFATDVLEGDLVTTLVMNGKGGDQAVNFGDPLRYTISYRNTGSVPLGDVSVSLVLTAEPQDGRLLRWNDLEDRREGLQQNGRVTWTSKQVEDLGRIDAGDEGTIALQIPMVDAPLPDVTEVDYRVSAIVETVIGTIDGERSERVTKTQPLTVRVNSDTDLTATARYFDADGIPVGSGPLPPIAGQATTYRVTWRLTNSFHELGDLTLSAKLPPNAAWTGVSSVDAGEMRFDAAAEKIIWTLNWLPVSIKELAVSFDVALTPEEAQIGKLPTIVDATILEATDRVTGASVLLSRPPITTGLDGDEFASGKGRVQSN